MCGDNAIEEQIEEEIRSWEKFYDIKLTDRQFKDLRDGMMDILVSLFTDSE
jgi:hypothetical protein